MYNLKAAIKKFIELSDDNSIETKPILYAYLGKDNFQKGIDGTVRGKKSCAFYKGDKSIIISPSIGQGTPSGVPALNFLGEGQKTTSGIFPVLLYYNKLDDSDKCLILSYGISATSKPNVEWSIPAGTKSIGSYFKNIKDKYNPKLLNYQTSYIYKIYYPDFTDETYDTIVSDVDKLVDYYLKTVVKVKAATNFVDNTVTLEEPIPFSVKTMIEFIGETGLLYSNSLIKRFIFSLMSKRFLILSGLAGSGKTQLALAFANALVKNKKKQMCVVSVGADWTNREPLLGFPDALQPNRYMTPESGVLDLLIEANKEENKNMPFFLILDEMNMSYVERYFADFLSALESHQEIPLWKKPDESASNVPDKIDLPSNLFIIGTINVDETTYMFSPKVLDRANVIEFKISENEMEKFLKEIKDIDCKSIIGKAANMGADFVEIARKKDIAKDNDAAKTLNDFFKELKGVNAEFGYRSATEIFRFICQAKANDDTDNKMETKDILDAAIVQKLLPKLHGSRKKLDPVLQRLWQLCFDGGDKDLNISQENVAKAKYEESADKIRRMYESANANGFTSFAEA